jgi:hypothetical protein
MLSLATTVATADSPTRFELPGACYCRAGTTLSCTPDVTQAACRQRCVEALCDDWFWLERLACWNWGYGG